MANPANQNQELNGKLSTLAVETYRWMVLARTFEDRISNIYRAGKIVGGVYVGKGQEAFSAALSTQLIKFVDRYRGRWCGCGCGLDLDCAGRQQS